MRRAAALDDRRLATIAYDTWSPEVSATPLWDAGRPFFREEAGLTTANTLVAFTPEAVVGFVAVAPFPYARDRWVVRALAVDVVFRRRGIGTTLVRAASEASAAAGARRLLVGVMPANTAAITMLTRLGFAEAAPDQTHRRPGGHSGAVTMSLTLRAPGRRPRPTDDG
ncbi:GNAT family N-acetyltransferase [Solicola sp. PLA-1-18]|uniref:GNAT family N-acetyltransferase n=1 Tax=Solicola sp. PLA-1-18 TaxID=3380532 RepID=UPI003B77426D